MNKCLIITDNYIFFAWRLHCVTLKLMIIATSIPLNSTLMPVIIICVLKVSKVDILFDASVTTNDTRLEDKHVHSKFTRLIITNSLYTNITK